MLIQVALDLREENLKVFPALRLVMFGLDVTFNILCGESESLALANIIGGFVDNLAVVFPFDNLRESGFEIQLRATQFRLEISWRLEGLMSSGGVIGRIILRENWLWGSLHLLKFTLAN